MADRMLKNELDAFGTLGNGTVYGSWQDISDRDLEQQKQKYIDNFKFGSKASARMDILGNKRWKEAAKSYLKDVKEKMSNAYVDGHVELAKEWMDNANNFIQNIKTFELQKVDDWAKQYNDETKGNKGGSTISKGSHKGDKRLIDMIYMGADNVDMQVAEEGDIYFKMRGVDDIATVADLNSPRVFLKNYKAIEMWENFKSSVMDKAKQGASVSASAIEGTVEAMLSNEQAILSLAHDNTINNKSMYEMYTDAAKKAGVNINPSPFMPESEDYNLGIIKQMVKDGLINMAKQTYKSYVPKAVVNATKLSAKDLLKKYRK